MIIDQRFRKRERLIRRGDFARVYAARRVASDGSLVVYVVDNGLGWSRLGLSVGKRVGGAVRRNLIRRRIREAFRKNKGSLPVGLDIVCVAKAGPPPTEIMFAQSLCTQIIKAARRPSSSAPACKPGTES